MTKKLSELTLEQAFIQRQKSSVYIKCYYAANADTLRKKAREYGKRQRLENPEKTRTDRKSVV